MEREPHEAMNLIDNMAQNQQWSGRKNSRPGGAYMRKIIQDIIVLCGASIFHSTIWGKKKIYIPK